MVLPFAQNDNTIMYINYESIIGLEIHVELKTKSKMFCGCYADWFGKSPNSNTCPVCLGLPGALPVTNKKAVEWCVLLGIALNCEIPEFSKFDRKNYFYPDLAKGYQISQYDKPFAINGSLEINTNQLINQSTNKPINATMKQLNNETMKKKIRIRRVHLEEDTGKLLHDVVGGKRVSLIDFNRSGVPLVEIVTEPDIRSSEEARIFLKKLYQIIRCIGISDADMEKGSLRIEPNISVRETSLRASVKQSLSAQTDIKIATSPSAPRNDTNDLPSYKVEVKNINSFSFTRKAIDFEIARHIDLLNHGETPIQETRGWDEKKGITYSQRSKEEAHDYRYFPEPDIPPIRWAESQISNFKLQIPELPNVKLARFMKDYQLSEYDAIILTDEKETAEYFEKTISLKDTPGVAGVQGFPGGGEIGIIPKTIANWIINKKADINKVSPEKLLKLIADQTQRSIIPDDELEKVIKKILLENPRAMADYKSGKENVLMFLLGQVMRGVKGKSNAEDIKQKLKLLLNLYPDV